MATRTIRIRLPDNRRHGTRGDHHWAGGVREFRVNASAAWSTRGARSSWIGKAENHDVEPLMDSKYRRIPSLWYMMARKFAFY